MAPIRSSKCPIHHVNECHNICRHHCLQQNVSLSRLHISPYSSSLLLLPPTQPSHQSPVNPVTLKNSIEMTVLIHALLCSISHFYNNVTSMISKNNRNNNGQITQLHFSKWKANRKMINYYTNSNCKIQLTGLILYIFHAIVLYTQIYTQLIT